MNKKILLLLLVIGTGICSLTTILSYQLLVYRCVAWTCAPSRTFTVYDIGIPEGFFPPDSLVGTLHKPSESLGEIEGGIMTVYWEQGRGRAVYNIKRFGSEGQASQFYIRSTKVMDYPEKISLSLPQNNVDEYDLGCGASEFGGYRCHVVARYEEFVITFNSSVDEKMSYEKFNDVVEYLDKEIGERLSES